MVGKNWVQDTPASSQGGYSRGAKGRQAGGELEEEGKSQTTETTGKNAGFVLNITEGH